MVLEEMRSRGARSREDQEQVLATTTTLTCSDTIHQKTVFLSRTTATRLSPKAF